ncbi:MAG: hypothetical protein ACYC8T_26565 [Myxococcaceae bacterium]
MLAGLLLVSNFALAAGPSGAGCTAPKVRDAQPLRKAVQEDGNLSISIDAVATACFDSEGEWNAGIPSGKRAKNALGPECKKAISSCVLANSARVRSAAAHLLDASAIADMERPFGGGQYAQQRPVPPVLETAGETVNCKAQRRSELFAMAQRRSDLSKSHALTLSDYARYRAWLELERQKCKEALDAPAPTVVETEQVGKPAGQGAGGSEAAPSAPVSEERRAALAAPLLQKWRYLAAEAQRVDADAEAKQNFAHSKESKECVCPRPNAGAIARSIEKMEGGEAGLALISADDAANTRCAVCFLDAYAGWKARVGVQCAGLAERSEYELNRLEQSDEGPAIPQRCFDRAREARAASQKLAVQTARVGGAAGAAGSGAGSGSGSGAGAAGSGAAGAAGAASPGAMSGAARAGQPGGVSGSGGLPSGPVPGATGTLITVNGMTYYRPYDAGTPAAQPAVSGPAPSYRAPTGPGSSERSGPQHDAFVPPQSYAPIPAREEGRLYVRVPMSSACVAEPTPGPIQARNGDLILVPFGAPTLEVKSPCGGVAEIYYGKEPTPRFSEIFGRNQPVSFVFRAQ